MCPKGNRREDYCAKLNATKGRSCCGGREGAVPIPKTRGRTRPMFGRERILILNVSDKNMRWNWRAMFRKKKEWRYRSGCRDACVASPAGYFRIAMWENRERCSWSSLRFLWDASDKGESKFAEPNVLQAHVKLTNKNITKQEHGYIFKTLI